MAKSINQVLLMGNLTRNPELSTTPSGANVCTFSLALNRTYQDGQGESREATDYIDIVAWGKLAEQVQQYLTVGSRAIVNGRFATRSWDDKVTGKKRTKIEVVANEVTFLDKAEPIDVQYS